MRTIADGIEALSWLRWLTPFGVLGEIQPYAANRPEPLLVLAAAALLLTAAALGERSGARLADGLDGPLARRRRAQGAGDAGAGGFFDITADLTVYGATVVGVAVGSSAERSRTLDDGRSLSFLGGLAEGGGTFLVHTLWLLLPFWAPQIAVVWAAVVGVSAAHRILTGHRALR